MIFRLYKDAYNHTELLAHPLHHRKITTRMAGDNSDNAQETNKPTLVLAAANKWSAYNIETYRERRLPLLKTVKVKGVEDLAREKMKDRMGMCYCLLL